jgi:hypothetical protein
LEDETQEKKKIPEVKFWKHIYSKVKQICLPEGTIPERELFRTSSTSICGMLAIP